MRLVRCVQCGEVGDLAKARTCTGCDHPLAEAPAARSPRQIPPAQREAGSDLGASKAILIGLLVGAGIALILIFLREGKAVSLAFPLSIVTVFLWLILVKPKKDGEASSDVASRPFVPPPPRAENGLRTCLMIVGGFVALVITGFVTFFIVCLAEINKSF